LSLIALALALSIDAVACITRIDTPNIEKPEQYRAIFTAVVLSIEEIKSVLSAMDVTPSYKITVQVPVNTIYGKTPKDSEFIINGGCGIPTPAVGDVGVFFQESSKAVVKPLRYYSANSPYLQQYTDDLKQLPIKTQN